MRVAYTAQPKTKGTSDLSLMLTYIRNKSHHEAFFFDESDKPDRKILNQVAHGVKKQEKKWI